MTIAQEVGKNFSQIATVQFHSRFRNKTVANKTKSPALQRDFFIDDVTD